MKQALNFGGVASDEATAVEQFLGDSVICSRCGAQLSDYADKCNVSLEEPCLGFLLIEGLRLHIRRRAA